MKTITYSIKDQLATVTLNRPDVRNAVNFDMIKDFQHVLTLIKQDKPTHVLLTGANNAFCSGGDLRDFHSLKSEEEAKTMLEPMGKVLREWVQLPALTVAYINGPCVGGGAELAIACDVRYGSEEARVGFVQASLAITTGWGGASLLKERVGYATAINLLSQATIHDASSLEKLGFLTILSKQTVLDQLNSYRGKRESIASYKEQLRTPYLLENMEQEVVACAKLWELDAHHQAVEAFLNK
ncbi:enoyl-CoA hydratase/isomerase family protein [Paenalkalicoccus suaedae]|uniref:Enoyl-CoA hydratase/isomerase family protein n=1 Tax=Paenalkalicoccus suaedae TaxID=2592382 RepID=A0A859FH68_9BACI|nr:enoyl-CoA hydratase/isomerase family protein [Paenalkalicoccus suaedae]QKS71536.1 enoyl-CoA hydratase/isomerase family protein [Paenalkalicoccus suaedae]